MILTEDCICTEPKPFGRMCQTCKKRLVGEHLQKQLDKIREGKKKELFNREGIEERQKAMRERNNRR